MQDLQKQLGMAIIMVTHDLGVIADMCDEIIVMYGGRVVNAVRRRTFFIVRSHEYTEGLLRSYPECRTYGRKAGSDSGHADQSLNMPKGAPVRAVKTR